MKAIGYFVDDVDATDEDHEEYVRGLIMKYGQRCFFCNLEGHFKSDCTQFWDAVADAKHPRHEEALSGVKASRARLMNEAESRRKETTPSTFTTKKVKTLPDEVVASNLEAESASPLKVDYGLAARTALQNVKQKTKKTAILTKKDKKKHNNNKYSEKRSCGNTKKTESLIVALTHDKILSSGY